MVAHDEILRELKIATPFVSKRIATATLVSYKLLGGQLSHTLVIANGIVDAVLNYQHNLEGAGFWRVSTIHSMGKLRLNELLDQVIDSGSAHDTESNVPTHAVLQVDLVKAVSGQKLNEQLIKPEVVSGESTYGHHCLNIKVLQNESRIIFTIYDVEGEELDAVGGPFSAIEVYHLHC